MDTLLLETATEKPLIALIRSGTPLAAKFLAPGPALSKNLALEVHALLGPIQPHRIAVGTGPGSYTGIRVGTALAKALAFGLQIPLIGFCSLKAFLPPVPGPFAILLDARMGGLYALKGLLQNGRPSFDTPRLIPLSEAPVFFADILHFCSPCPFPAKLPGPWLEVSPNLAFLAKLIEETPPQKELSLTYLSCPE